MLKFESYAQTNVGLVRKANEDAFGEIKTELGHVFVVCDGMGGHVGGARASQLAVKSILEFLSKSSLTNPLVALDQSIQFANEQIYATALDEPELKGMGTTAVVVLISEQEVFLAHVGDSRIYLKTSNALHRLTSDHSFVQTLVQQGIITDEEAESHPKKNQILRALGIAPNVDVEVQSAPMCPQVGDILLLCSDGLNGMVNDSELLKLFALKNLHQVGEAMINQALKNGGKDNVTLTLIQFLESPHPTSIFESKNPISRLASTVTLEMGETTQLATLKKTPQSYHVKRLIIAVVLISLLTVLALLFSNKSKETIKPGQNTTQQNDTLPTTPKDSTKLKTDTTSKSKK